MKKTILMLAGIAVLASCAKEIAPDVYEQAPAATGKFTIVADRGGDTDTKVAYNPLVDVAQRTTWKKEDKLGIFTYKAPTEADESDAEWTNYPGIVDGNPFSTNKLFEGKTSASFTGDLKAFSGYIYGVYPSPAQAAMGTPKAKKGTITFTYDENKEGVTFSSDAVVKDKNENDLYISNATEATNSIILFRSSEKFSLENELEGTALPALTGKTISAKINLTLAKEDKGENMEDEFAKLQSIKLTALDETGEKVAAFHKEMKINLLDFEAINSLKLADNEAKAIKDALYTGAAEPVESLTFTADYTLKGGKEIVLPIILFPTEKFAKIKAEIEWIDNAGVSETTEATIGWTSAHQLGAGANIGYWDTITLGKSIGTNITDLPAGVDDVRNYIIEAIKAGKTHIKVGNAEELLLYNHNYTNQAYAEVYNQNPALIIPEEASGKDIVIEAYVKDDPDSKFTPLFKEGYKYEEGGSLTFILKNTTDTDDTDLQYIEFVLDDPKANIILTSAEAKVLEGDNDHPAPAYKKVTVNAAKDFTLAAVATELNIGKDAKPELVKIAADVTNVSINDKAAIETLIVEKGGRVQTLDTKATKNITINGSVARKLTVNPTLEGTNITVGKFTNANADANEHGFNYGFVRQFITADVVVEGLKYSSFTIDGQVNIGPLNTQNAPSVEINGNLSDVEVTVNPTTGEGTTVTLGKGAKVKQLNTTEPDPDNETIYKSFVLNGEVKERGVNVQDVTSITVGEGAKIVGTLTAEEATQVVIEKGATVESLVVKKAEEITVNGTLGTQAAVRAIDTDTAHKVKIGKDAKVTGSIYVIPEKAETDFENTGVVIEQTAAGIQNIEVGNVYKLDAQTAPVAGFSQYYDIENVKVVFGEKYMNIYQCNGIIDILALDTNEASPVLSFYSCDKADLMLTGYNDQNNALNVATAKNITITKGSFTRNITLNATENINIKGGKTADMNTFGRDMFLTAGGNISVDAFNTFSGTSIDEGEGSSRLPLIVLDAKGTVAFTGAETNILDMNNKVGLLVNNASKFTMTYVKVGHVTSYTDATLTNCAYVLSPAGAEEQETKLHHMWKFSNDPKTVTFTLKVSSNAAFTDVNLKSIFMQPYMEPKTGSTIPQITLNTEKAIIVFYKGNAYSTYKYSELAGINVDPS